MYIKALKLKFLAIPKTGTTSFIKALNIFIGDNRVSGRHDTYEQSTAKIKRAGITGVKHFTFWRDPIDRALSGYIHWSQVAQGRGFPPMPFLNWLVDEISDPELNNFRNILTKTQYEFIGHDVSNMFYIGNIKTRQKDFNELLARLNMEPINCSRVINTAESRSFKYELTGEDIHAIKCMYDCDFNILDDWRAYDDQKNLK